MIAFDASIRVEDPKGAIAIGIDANNDGTETGIEAASVIRTARPLFRGEIMVPTSVWPSVATLREAA